MHKKIYTFVSAVFFCLITISVWAQGNGDPKKAEMADKFRADGKIYVVVAVLVTILTGLFIYLARLDKKINKLEKDFNK